MGLEMGRGQQRKPILDERSTGRKRARAVLLVAVAEGLIEFKCRKCGFIPVGELSRDNNLDAQHKNKNWMDNDLANLEWLCRKCHKEEDRQTEKGVSLKDDEYGYGLGNLSL